MICCLQAQPEPQAAPPAEQPPPAAAAAPPKEKEAPVEKQEVKLGESAGIRTINPLDFVKRSAPLLSQEKTKAPERALGRLEDAAARDETCVWQRVRTIFDLHA